MFRSLHLLLLPMTLWAAAAAVIPAAEPVDQPCQPPPISWHTDYSEAMDAAKQQGTMLLIFFHGPQNDQQSARFETDTLNDPAVRAKLQDYVCARLPLSATIVVQGEDLSLLQHEAFKEMLGKPGVAILDFTDPKAKTYGYVVSAFPLTSKLWYDSKKMQVILDLPPATLTQRTLIYAVRTHPDKPASTDGAIDPNLLKEAESHSQYQARIRLQGHHRWAARFPRISALLPGGLSAREVCAESWPGENLVEAAVECVRCWRLSSGHWSAVRAPQRFYGYDMKRGRNGIWYATGIFGGR